MCTVSFIPVGEIFFITSNRDENKIRAASAPPRQYCYNGQQILFPRDSEAGGSWICLSERGNAAVLLNGAFGAHEKKTRYKKSRGLVFLDVVTDDQPLQKFLLSPFSAIEPFTIILWQMKNLYELRSDESGNKYIRQLSRTRSHLWSSTTLYNKEAQERKQVWFEDWLTINPRPTVENIFGLHKSAQEREKQNGFFLNGDTIGTVSITNMQLGENFGKMIYNNCVSGERTTSELHFSTPAPAHNDKTP